MKLRSSMTPNTLNKTRAFELQNTSKHRLSSASLRVHGGVRFRGNTANTTTIKPFSFLAKDQAILLSRKRAELEATVERSRMATSFRAQPMPVGPPHQLPEARPKRPTVAMSPQLHTMSRAQRRLSFEGRLAAKRISLERRLAEEMERLTDENAKALKQLRKDIVHKPEPIRTYKPIPSPSRKPLTRIKSFKISRPN